MPSSSPPELTGPSRGHSSLFGGGSLDRSESPPAAQVVPNYAGSDDSIYGGGNGDAGSSERGQDIKDEDHGDDRSVAVKYETDSLAPSGSSSDDESPRPNRYYGPLSTWRTWTRHDRREVAALDTIRARDLSIHLYNSFALKRRARDARRQISQSSARQGFSGGQGEDYSDLFAPTRNWTAWPVPADVVPRGDEHAARDQDDAWTLRGPQDYRPSAELEECLIAKMLKDSKEKFRAREWDSRHYSQAAHKRAKTTPLDADRMTPMKDESDNSDSLDCAANLRPMVQADDEKSKRILHPTARHVLTKFDELLSNLYEARQAYATIADGHDKGDETEDERISNGFSAEKDDGNQTPKRGKRQRSKSKSVIAAEQSDGIGRTPNTRRSTSINTKNKGSRSTGRSRPPHSRLGLRDWSDVLGIAAMTGLPNAAVMRASRRCADLFGEDMFFRNMDDSELRLERPEGEGPRWKYVDDTDDEIHTARPGTNPPDKEKSKLYYAVCPVTDCPRHTKGFSRTWNLNQHLKIKHPELMSAKRPGEVGEEAMDTGE